MSGNKRPTRQLSISEAFGPSKPKKRAKVIDLTTTEDDTESLALHEQKSELKKKIEKAPPPRFTVAISKEQWVDLQAVWDEAPRMLGALSFVCPSDMSRRLTPMLISPALVRRQEGHESRLSDFFQELEYGFTAAVPEATNLMRGAFDAPNEQQRLVVRSAEGGFWRAMRPEHNLPGPRRWLTGVFHAFGSAVAEVPLVVDLIARLAGGGRYQPGQVVLIETTTGGGGGEPDVFAGVVMHDCALLPSPKVNKAPKDSEDPKHTSACDSDSQSDDDDGEGEDCDNYAETDFRKRKPKESAGRYAVRISNPSDYYWYMRHQDLMPVAREDVVCES